MVYTIFVKRKTRNAKQQNRHLRSVKTMDQQQASSANKTSGSPELLCAPRARPVTEVKERSSPHELMKKLGDTAPSSKGATIRILHLEDEPDFCRLVEDFL